MINKQRFQRYVWMLYSVFENTLCETTQLVYNWPAMPASPVGLYFITSGLSISVQSVAPEPFTIS